ncbi:hypothetical protein PYW08_016962 [Mythimna loreyi]|nr:hypothetical protein PYW08_016962 [Mythimna loreyi]
MDEFINIFISELLESSEHLANTRRRQRTYPAVDIYDLNLKTKVLCTLHFLGTGSYQTPTGNLNKINVSQATTSRCISDVVEELNHPNIFHQWVRFPRTLQELQTIALDFYNCYGFPGVIGCIDCTHVAIVPPPRDTHDERSYVNRKNFHSINTQLICDSKLKILNVNALFPGSTHDSYIWSNSAVLPLLQNLHNAGYTNYHLLGDSGYPLRPWCLTPILDLEEDIEENTPVFLYNEALKKTRSIIERCNGVLKGRFRCLLKDRVLHYAPNKATKIINACCVLHNLCITHNFELTDMPEERELGISHVDPLPATGSNIYLNLGRQKQNIINNYFT